MHSFEIHSFSLSLLASPLFSMHYCAPLANKLGVETRISTTLVESVGARVIAFVKPRRSSPSNRQSEAGDDACTDVIALEAYAEVSSNGLEPRLVSEM